MISFYPGPSRVYDAIPQYVKDAHAQGVLSMNHRSAEFMALMKKTVTLLKRKLNIPKDYTIFFTASATECWEIIAQCYITNKSFHVYNGAFGQKWFEYTHKLNSKAVALPFGRETVLNPTEGVFEGAENILCITQNETSNGTQISNTILQSIRKKNPDHLIAVDATSSMAGIKLDFKSGDIWFASVQKCFGLPAGLGIMICSPRAIERAHMLNHTAHYNNIVLMTAMMRNWQTSYTPNVLGIYLLMRVLEKVKSISEIHALSVNRYKAWITVLQQASLTHLIKNTAVHSFTVLPIQADEKILVRLKRTARANGFLLGDGYGVLKASTIRIANFPALKETEVKTLMKLLQRL